MLPVHLPNARRLASLLLLAAQDAGTLNLRFLGGKGSGNFKHEGRKGEVGGSAEGSIEGKERNARSLRSLKHFIPAPAGTQRHAEKNELRAAKMAGGKPLEGVLGADGKMHRNAPVDVVSHHGGRTQGIEVKTLINQENNKLTVRKNAGVLKTHWGRSNHASVHILAFDDRKKLGNPHYSGHDTYYRRGHGSFRLGSMIKVRNAAHLQELLSK